MGKGTGVSGICNWLSGQFRILEKRILDLENLGRVSEVEREEKKVWKKKRSKKQEKRRTEEARKAEDTEKLAKPSLQTFSWNIDASEFVPGETDGQTGKSLPDEELAPGVWAHGGDPVWAEQHLGKVCDRDLANDEEEEEDEYVEHSEFTEPCCGDRKGEDYAGGKLCMENGVEEEMSEEEANEDKFARYVVLPAAFLAWQDLAASWRRKKKRKKKGKKKKEEKMIDQTKDQPAKLKEEIALRETFAETDKTDAVPNLGRNDRGAEYLWKRLQKLETEQGRAQRDVMVRSLSEHTQARLERYVDGNSWQSAAAASTEPTPTDDKPFWMRMPEDVTQKDYAVFYKAWTDSQENFFSVRHFSGEGPGFRALLFVPRKAPADLVAGVRQGNNIRLYVRSAFLMADCNGLLPEWLNFVEGVVDLEALPSDLSCEVLQQNKILGFIGQRLVEKCLEMFAEIAEVEDDYMDFYGQFGDCLRLGVREKSSRAKVAELLRYPSSKSGGKLIGFRDYGDWEMEGQDVITYTTKASIAAAMSSPKWAFLPGQTLFMLNPLDVYAVQHLVEFDGKMLYPLNEE